jgi:hypothetical protein
MGNCLSYGVFPHKNPLLYGSAVGVGKAATAGKWQKSFIFTANPRRAIAPAVRFWPWPPKTPRKVNVLRKFHTFCLNPLLILSYGELPLLWGISTQKASPIWLCGWRRKSRYRRKVTKILHFYSESETCYRACRPFLTLTSKNTS